MLVIRLTRVGKKNTPAFRVVVADKQKAVKRKFIEIIGHFNPAMNPKTIVIDKEKALEWMKKGAQPSETVLNLMCDLDILPKNRKIKVVHGKATKKKDKGKSEEKIEEIEAKSGAEGETEVVAEEKPESADEVAKEAIPEATIEASADTTETEK